MQAQPVTTITEAEFLSLPESMDKTELVDGEVVVSPSPSVRHQVILQHIVAALSSWRSSQPTPVFIGQAPLDVRFGPGRILQPDAFVILDEVAIDHEGPIDRVPELCVEVLSSNRVYDRVAKRAIYAAAGVAEYWTVEPSGVIERWYGPGLVERELCRSSAETPLLPGLTVEISTLAGPGTRRS